MGIAMGVKAAGVGKVVDVASTSPCKHQTGSACAAQDSATETPSQGSAQGRTQRRTALDRLLNTPGALDRFAAPHAAAMLVLIALIGCSEEQPISVPPPPPGFEKPAEDPLGTAAAMARDRVIVRVLRQVGPSSGKSLSEQTYLAPAQVKAPQLRGYYDARAKANGCSALPIAKDGLGAGEAFGFGGPGQGFAVIVQPPLAPAAKRPVTIVTFERPGG